jgi:hypothetical protein
MSKAALREAIDHFVQNLLALINDFPHLRLNLIFPAYILEHLNPLLLSQLRDICKKGHLEWLLTGYTEPFLSLSPDPLTNNNIKTGLQVFTELNGETPRGYYPPFSNFEPSMIELIKNNGIQFIVVSNRLLPENLRPLCGYWMAEYSGSSIAVITSELIRQTTAPADFKDWLEKIYNADKTEQSSDKIAVLQYQIPLKYDLESNPYRWLHFAASEIDKHVLNYQTHTCSDLLNNYRPIGLQYIPSSLLIGTKDQVDLHFLNYLHTFDHIGIIQRKLMDIHNSYSSLKEMKNIANINKQLFAIQDINRLLPSRDYGFDNPNDRMWTYSKLIELERDLFDKCDINGGQIRITDFLRNGNKSIILTNRKIKLYIDYNCGGTIFEFDYNDRLLNLCSGYNPEPHVRPDILLPGKSRTWFIDRIFPEETTGSDLIHKKTTDLGNFYNGQYAYKVSKNSNGIKTSLVKQGSILRGDKPCPLSIEKVFGLEKDSGIVSFVYQLSNPSLTTYTFRFTTELTICLPGLSKNTIKIVSKNQTFEKMGLEYNQMEAVTNWYIEDRTSGIRIHFLTQKPLDIWCLPSILPDSTLDPFNGVRLILSSIVTIEQSSQWKLIGKITCKKIRKKAEDIDAV